MSMWDTVSMQHCHCHHVACSMFRHVACIMQHELHWDSLLGVWTPNWGDGDEHVVNCQHVALSLSACSMQPVSACSMQHVAIVACVSMQHVLHWGTLLSVWTPNWGDRDEHVRHYQHVACNIQHVACSMQHALYWGSLLGVWRGGDHDEQVGNSQASRQQSLKLI